MTPTIGVGDIPNLVGDFAHRRSARGKEEGGDPDFCECGDTDRVKSACPIWLATEREWKQCDNGGKCNRNGSRNFGNKGAKGLCQKTVHPRPPLSKKIRNILS